MWLLLKRPHSPYKWIINENSIESIDNYDKGLYKIYLKSDEIIKEVRILSIENLTTSLLNKVGGVYDEDR
jgi:hypothetical protein